MSTKLKDTDSMIYLGKGNKIYGPFSTSELDQMATSGKLASYVWIWDHTAEQWKPLETPPPPPVQTSKASKKSQEWSFDAALCYDQTSTVSGTLESITETGCVLISKHTGATPRFALKSKVTVNVLDTKKNHSKNTKAKIIDITRGQNQWNYRLRWS